MTMPTEKVSRWRAIFASLEKAPCLIGNEFIADGGSVGDDVIKVACTHSIAISLRRIADTLDKIYEDGVSVSISSG